MIPYCKTSYVPSMRTIETMLTGENLVLYHNIQKTIRLTQRKALALNEETFPILWDEKYEKSLSPGSGDDKSSSTSDDFQENYFDNTAWNEEQLRALRRNNYGFRDMARETSDYMRDEPKTKPLSTDNILSKLTPTSIPNQISIPEELNAPKEGEEIDMRLYDELTLEEQKTIYNKICARYGQESGRRYLLVRGLTAPGKKIQAWTTECPPRKAKSTQEQVSCPKLEATEPIYICSDVSDSAKKKMATLVDLTPMCTTETKITAKNWRSNLKRKPPMTLHISVKGESDMSFSSELPKSEVPPCPCGLHKCDCDRVRDKCHVPKPKEGCALVDEGNDNFLVTCREKLKGKKLQNRRDTSLQLHAFKVANRMTRESVYLQSAYDQTKTEFETCLVKVIPPREKEAIEIGRPHVETLTNVFAEHKMINEQDWRAWRNAQTIMDNIDNSDEMDSMDSDIATSESSEELISDSNLKVPQTLQPSRIPYFKETYQLANVLFGKLNTKMEKIIAKNKSWKLERWHREGSLMLLERINLLKSSGKIFDQTTKLYKAHQDHTKKLIPFVEKKRRKQVRANMKNADSLRKQRFRKYIEGIQLGKRFKKHKRSFLFTKLENFRGFSPRRQKLLQEPGDGIFAKCDLVGNKFSGRAPNKKTMHKDYRLIRRMFEDRINRSSESLWDPGMLARMKEYQGEFRDAKEAEDEDEEEDMSGISLVASQKIPNKEEQKTQTAMPPSWSYCSGSGNAAETLTSMIRSLRWEAESHAAGVSSKPLSVSDGDPNPQACNTTSRGAGRERVGSKSDLGLGNRSKERNFPSPREKSQLKRPFTQGNAITPKTDSRSDQPMRDFSRGTHSNPRTALPPIRSRPSKAS